MLNFPGHRRIYHRLFLLVVRTTTFRFLILAFCDFLAGFPVAPHLVVTFGNYLLGVLLLVREVLP